MKTVEFLVSNIIIQLIVGYNVSLLVHYIYSSSLGKKRQTIFILSFGLSIALLRQLIVYATATPIVIMLKVSIYLVAFILIYIILKLRFWKSVFILCVAVLSMSIGESIILLSFVAYGIDAKEIMSGQNIMLYNVANIFINTFQMIVLQLLRLARSVKVLSSGIKNKTYTYIVLNIVLATTAITATTAILSLTKQSIITIGLFSSISIIGLICNIMSINMILKVDFRDEKLKMQEQYNDILIDLKHKFSGIVSILTALTEEGDIDKIRGYVKELETSIVESIKNMPTNIINNKLFYLVAAKLSEANEEGIALKVVIPYEINKISGIGEDDLVYILNELLNNAIEHAKKSTDKEIYMKIEDLTDYIKISIENSIEDYVKDNKLKILNTNQNKAGRGHGLKQVKKLLGPDTYFKIGINDTFSVELIIEKK